MAWPQGNPGAGLRQQANEKPFRAALVAELKATDGTWKPLRRVAKKLVERANRGDVRAIVEVADRLDGKVPQAIISDDDGSPMVLQVVRYVVSPPLAVPDIEPAKSLVVLDNTDPPTS